jgi:hypothetical protein
MHALVNVCDLPLVCVNGQTFVQVLNNFEDLLLQVDKGCDLVTIRAEVTLEKDGVNFVFFAHVGFEFSGLI